MPDILMRIFYFFVALFPLVLIHELGHFIVAKMNDVRVDEFGIGFPPRLMKVFSAGGTDYTLNALPLGGFVRLAGEDDPTIPGAFAAKSKIVRSAVLLAGPIANFLLAALIFSGVALFIGVMSALPMGGGMVHVINVLEESPAAEAGIEANDMLLGINGESLLAGPLEADAPTGSTPTDQALVRAVDESVDAAMPVTLLRGVEQAQVSDWDLKDITYAPVEALASIEGLDALEVTGLNDLNTSGTDTVSNAGDQIAVGDIVVEVGGVDQENKAFSSTVVFRPETAGEYQVMTLDMVPAFDSDLDRAVIGIQFSSLRRLEKLGFVPALMEGPKQTISLMGMMVTGLYQMLTGQIAADVAGPVGIAKMSQDAGDQGIETLLIFMALLSINLGIINLVPIPALDGGRLLFILIEALRGRRIEPNREAVVHLIGFVLVIGLMVVITFAEVTGRLGGTP